MRRSFLPALTALLLTSASATEASSGGAGAGVAVPSYNAPSAAFDLRGWKITLPGPVEIKNLEGYSSKYFDLNGQKEMCFHLDASEKGPTTGAHFVRSELRHLTNWKTTDSHALSGEMRVSSRLKPDKVTVLQIHGINPDLSNAPPLLRVAVDNGDLNAHVKSDAEGEKTDTVLLLKDLGTNYAKVDVVMEGGQLRVSANGVEKLRKDLPYWTCLNYFKAGCYPQTTEGTVDVMFRSLTVR